VADTRKTVADTVVHAVLTAATSGGFASLVTTPVDAVKMRGGGHSKKLVKAAEEVMVEEVFLGFWRGGALRTVWSMLGSGLYLGVYEGSRFWQGNESESAATGGRSNINRRTLNGIK
jgi:solute carrier family 25 S-adenosylmethionine transporter 26